MAIIDSHTHIVPPEISDQRERFASLDPYFGLLYTNPRARLATANDLLTSLERNQVDAAVTFGWAFADPALCRLCNDYTLTSAVGSRNRLFPFAVVNPARPGYLVEAERCLAAGAVGFGELMPVGQGYDLDDPGLDALLDLAAEADVPVLLHLNEPVGHDYPGKGPHGPREVWSLIRRHPDNDLILAHWGGGLLFYELMPEVHAACSRVYYDSAASYLLYAGTIFQNVLAWAPGRVLWGTDYPLLSQHSDLARIRALNLPVDLADGLLGGNLAHLLGCGERAG